MANKQALSTQEVADILHVSKSTIYDLIRKGEINSYKIGRKVRFTEEDVNAYINRSRHKQFIPAVQKMDTHSTLLTPPEQPQPDLILSGQDVILDMLSDFLRQRDIVVGRTHLSSFEGLLSLYEKNVDASACHLYDGKSYNASYISAMMPGVPAVMYNISYRYQGFYVKEGNPKKITGWEDLGRKDVSILNRRPGSSARILLDLEMKKRHLTTKDVNGYDRIIKSHLTAATMVAQGEADVAIGTERVAKQVDGIAFIPLQEERYDLVVRKEDLDEPAVRSMLEILKSRAFYNEVSQFSGNDFRDIGKIMGEI